MFDNYFKVCGPGLGRVGDCFPFNSRDSVDIAVAYERAMLAQYKAGRMARVVSWRPTAHHTPIVGRNSHHTAPDLKVTDDS